MTSEFDRQRDIAAEGQRAAAYHAKHRTAMLDPDCRPETRARTLMFVAGVKGRTIGLAKVGDETTRADISTQLPTEVLLGLIGRQCWLLANWGGPAEIEKWVDLPVWREE